MKRKNWEDDEERWPDGEAYRIDGHDGIAWRVFGWETEPDEDTHWSGIENRTGRVVCVMIGDDHRWTFDPSEVHRIEREEFCGVCGQMGCTHDGLVRE